MKPYRFHREARAEYRAALAWYAARSLDAADGFADASRKVYGGAPVDVWFVDGMFRPHAKLSLGVTAQVSSGRAIAASSPAPRERNC